ncbi:MAG: aspartate/glutamate racemase family protein [Promethearchaeota archaeon]
MKSIGLLGGMSWHSSQEYYQIINEKIKEKLGGLHSAKIVLFSVDFEEVVQLQLQGNWEKMADIMIDAAKRIEKAGADLLLICANTTHKVADEVAEKVTIPLLHIADSTAEKIKEKNLRKVGLLGTKFTMEEEFYTKRLAEKHELSVIIPTEEERQIIHDILYKELAFGEIKDSSKEKYLVVIQHMIEEGAEGIILGCTEIPLLVKQEDVKVPVFNTTEIHAISAIDFALKE